MEAQRYVIPANPPGFISGDDGVGDTPATLPRGAAWRERSQDATLTPHEIPVTKMLHIWGASLWVAPPPPGTTEFCGVGPCLPHD